ncbi:MAG: hypothetical protein AAGB24_06390 [Bacteroidota bacterium]
MTIQYPHIEFVQSLKGLGSIHKFLTKQVAGWEEYTSIPNGLNPSKQHFVNLKIKIENFVNIYDNHNAAQLNNPWRAIIKDDSGPTMPNDIAGKIFGGK